MFGLPLTHKDFPPPLSQPHTVEFSKSKLCWAALTVGKPDRTSLTDFAQYSLHEARFRWNIVKAAVDFSYPPHMKNSPLFDALDPTEKGGINFYLGMISAKLCADIVLDIDWLIHLSWMKENHALTLLAGKSAPDMLGKKADGTWSVFEAKGRNGGLLEADARKAKDQSNKAIAVDGTLCDLHVGGVLFRDPSSGRHCYHWRDPKPDDDRQYYLETNRNTWIQYYALPYFLHQIAEEDPDRFLTENGFMVRLTDDAYDFASKLIETNQDYSNELGNLMQSAGARRRSGVVLKGANADGTIIKLRDDQ